MTNEEIIQQLNKLIETCKDGELGYHTAAESVKNTQLESELAGYSKQRASFVRQLHAEVERLGGKPVDTGSTGATVFRGWMHLKSALTGGSAHAILSACETAEETAIGAYAIALRTDLTGATHTLVDKQSKAIQETHAHIQRLQRETESNKFPRNE